MSTIFKTNYNYREEQPQSFVNVDPSETQPDELLSVREMLERHVRGLPVAGNDNGVYLDDELGYIPDIQSLDLTEIKDLQDEYKNRSKEIENELKTREKNAADQAAKESAREAKLRAYLDSKINPEGDPPSDD